MKDSLKYFEYINAPVGMLCIIASRDALESVQFVLSTHASLYIICVTTFMPLSLRYRGSR
jgi:hypothetical protein